MNIQLSVIIWTVICFLALMTVLDRLLFRPVLALLDERAARLAAARQKKLDREVLEQQQRQEREQLLARAETERKEATLRALESLAAEEKTLLKDAHKDCLAHIDAYKDQREKELEDILAAVSPEMAKAADLFVKRIVSYGE